MAQLILFHWFNQTLFKKNKTALCNEDMGN